jgi:sugar phosphate isomerase/epimerase
MAVPGDPATVLLGTVAVEPNRWGMLDPSGRATVTLSDWLPAIADAGFDGIELWDRHVVDAPPDEVRAVLGGALPVTIFNSYVGFDDPEPAARDVVAGWVARAGSTGVKFNVGNDPTQVSAYAERVAAWVERLPEGSVALCECHEGTSVAADPAVAASLLSSAGPPDRVQAIVHTHEHPDHLRRRFDLYGDRIGHVHVNFLDGGRAPGLVEVRDRLGEQVALLRSLGFDGTWTVEFVRGVLTADDDPEHLVGQAAEDLVVLRDVLDTRP